jgi:cellulose biosynthesis protein BcsQ
VIPGHPKISQIEQGLRQNLPDMDPGIAMVAPIQKLRDMYDYILIDAPAQGVEPAVLMALSACDKVVIVEPSSDLLADVSVAQTETNAKLQTVMADHLIPSSLAGNLIDEE